MGSMDIKNLIKNLESIDPIHSYPSQIQLLEYYKHNPANFNQDLESNQFNYKSPNTMNLIHLFCKYNRINQISTPTLYQFYSILMTLEFNIIINEYFHLCVFLDILKFWSLQSTSKSELYSIQYGKLYKPWSKKVQSQSQLICDLLLVNDNDIVLKSTQILLLLLNNPNLDLVTAIYKSIDTFTITKLKSQTRFIQYCNDFELSYQTEFGGCNDTLSLINIQFMIQLSIKAHSTKPFPGPHRPVLSTWLDKYEEYHCRLVFMVFKFHDGLLMDILTRIYMYFKSVKNEYGFYEYMIEFFKLVDFDHITVLDLVLVDMKLMNLLLGSFVELILKDVDRFRLFCVSNVANHNHGMVVDDDMDVCNDDVSTSDSMNYDTSSQGSFAPLTCIDDEIDFFYSIITTLKDLNHSLVTSSNSSSYRSLSDELIKLNSVDE